MRKLLLAILVVLMASALFAQTNTVDSVDSYTVESGDTMWGLAQAYRQNGEAWRDLITMNPWIQERITELPNGEAHVLIRPGETLRGITRAEAMGEEPITVDLGIQVGPGPAWPPAVTEVSPSQSSPMEYFTEPTNQFAWPWLLMILAAIVLIWWTFRYFNRPATAGRAVLEGGIRPTHVAEDLDRAVATAYTRATGSTSSYPVRIAAIHEATFHGPGRAGYATNLRPRHFNGEAGYTSRYRFPDGHEEDANFMQACGNDYWLMNMRYFPSEVRRGAMVVPAPAAATTTTATATATAATGTTPVVPEPPATPTPEPPTPAAPLAEVVHIGNPGANGTTTLVVGDRQMEFQAGARITVHEKGLEVQFGDGMTLSVSAAPQPKAKKARKASSPAAPATGTAS